MKPSIRQNRFDPARKYVARRNVTINGVDHAPGDPVDIDAITVKRRARQLYDRRWITLAHDSAADVAIGDFTVVAGKPGWFNVVGPAAEQMNTKALRKIPATELAAELQAARIDQLAAEAAAQEASRLEAEAAARSAAGQPETEIKE